MRNDNLINGKVGRARCPTKKEKLTISIITTLQIVQWLSSPLTLALEICSNVSLTHPKIVAEIENI